MAAGWYVEKRSNETWLSLSDMFMDWVQANAELKNFGFHEGAELVAGSMIFACFQVPNRHGANFELFDAWADTTGRVFGKALNGTVNLSDGAIVKLRA